METKPKKMKPAEVIARIHLHATSLLFLWQSVQGGDSWTNREAKQAYYNALNSLKQHGLIEDFSLTKGITFKNTP